MRTTTENHLYVESGLPNVVLVAEVRFLRKHLGWSGADFAAHMGVDPTTVSAWENERKPFGTSSDRLLRLIVARQAPSRTIRSTS
jgi:DNA-binding transcriptional regulator YiaG